MLLRAMVYNFRTFFKKSRALNPIYKARLIHPYLPANMAYRWYSYDFDSRPVVKIS